MSVSKALLAKQEYIIDLILKSIPRSRWIKALKVKAVQSANTEQKTRI